MSITRTCRSCGRPLPASKRSDAVYCTAACSSRAHRRRSGIGPRAKRCRDRPEASLAKEDAAYRTAIEAQTAALATAWSRTASPAAKRPSYGRPTARGNISDGLGSSEFTERIARRLGRGRCASL